MGGRLIDPVKEQIVDAWRIEPSWLTITSREQDHQPVGIESPRGEYSASADGTSNH